MMGSQAQMPNRLFVLICISFCIFKPYYAADQPKTEIIDIQVEDGLVECENATFVCKVAPVDSIIWWTVDGRPVSNDDRFIMSNETTIHIIISYLNILCVAFEDSGNYTCHASDTSYATNVSRDISFNVGVIGKVIHHQGGKMKKGSTVTLSCLFKGSPLEKVEWLKGRDISTARLLTNGSSVNYLNDTFLETKLKIIDISRQNNGTYYCKVSTNQGELFESVTLFVLDEPKTNIDFVKAIGASRVYLNWTVDDGNEPVDKYYLMYKKQGEADWTYLADSIGGGNTSFIITELSPNTSYQFSLSGVNRIGQGTSSPSDSVTTLAKDPDFVPDIEVKGVTPNSITVGWSSPPRSIEDHVHYYQLVIKYNDTKKETFVPADVKPSYSIVDSKPSYSFEDLLPATTYYFKVSACSDYGKSCWNWSKDVNGTTMDGVPGPPYNVSVSCKFDNISRTSFVYVTWEPPIKTNGKIKHYNVILEGDAIYKNERGTMEKKSWRPEPKYVDERSHSARFDMIPANTNYSVRVSGVTRSRSPGPEVKVRCGMPSTIPDKDKLTRFRWMKIEEPGRWLFKLFLPRVSERNGPICCYRVILIKLEPQQSIADLPAPEDVEITTYDDVHHNKRGGAYVAEMFESNMLMAEVFLGDGITSNVETNQCRECFAAQPSSSISPEDLSTTFSPHMFFPVSTYPPFTTTSSTVKPSTIKPTTTARTTHTTQPVPTITSIFSTSRSNIHTNTEHPTTTTIKTDSVSTLVDGALTLPDHTATSATTVISESLRKRRSAKPYLTQVQDGQLDMSSNYTGFVEITVFGPNKNFYSAYSGYFVPLNPGPQVVMAEPPQLISIVLQVLCGIIFIVLVLLVALCLLQRYTKQVAEAQGVEMTLRNSFRHLCRGLRGGHVLVSSSPPDMTPIAKENLVAAFIERHRDSDYGFQHEFELLPDRFPDRTTRASEARENMYKNRYPDIKAYDQTRVKLSNIDNVIGGDYINANFVIGYKERKKFICAQGPMDNTVCDFWRMIWEQHLELILMLTNLEEYSKTKCAKYWPDEGDKIFGDISITHMQEKRYSDYIIRELKMTRTFTDKEKEERSIIQYHFLVWKDFMAPEHPSGILKFIKRMNEAYSLEKGPILIHCSAGVGRTGTLVALDSLLQQLEDEGQVSIFNTVCDLRHQRNFLVQSLKQYIFVYRALMEVAQFGDTELKISKCKSAVEKLRQRENGKEKCQMEEDFEKISRVIEDRKSFSVGGGEENKIKNRSELVIPYDRNRVILTPVPGREHSTYINASFIEGYDNSESFIITQDPLDVTIADFWRMISEQGITTLVMLSDLGEGPKKCLRYWPDDEVSHDHIKVKYIQSESCPYYTRREFSVTNSKTDENFVVTQFQYNGWPTVEGEVPEVTRGLIELVDQTQSHQEANGGTGPITVHCSCGAERSSIFVALSILVQQMRTEKRVDIFTATRKLRSQRHGMLQTFAQYEFLHRAIVNYVDLHHLTEEEC